VAKSAPDGYTLLLNAVTPMVTVVHLQKTPYNLLKDMNGVAQTSTFDYVLAVNQKSGITSMQDLINKAKAEPGKLNYASAGTGSGQHMLVEMVRSLAGIDVQHIPYKGNAPAMQALLSGEVSFIFDTTLGINTQLPSGRIRPLMTSSPKPLAAFPGLPTMDSLFQGNSTQGWHGVFAPAATPKDVLLTLAHAIQKAVNSPELSAKLRELGLEPSNLSGDAFNDLIRRDFERWGQVIRDNNIKAD
jgi:tripartite-type tricarboxylate transporter receptor subunit TctC